MMQKMIKSQKTIQMATRMFSYNYSAAGHPQVWMDISKDGNSAGRLTFELYQSHSPALVENFQELCDAESHRTLVGSTFSSGTAGFAITGGDKHEEENRGAADMRLADENLEMRHHKRGILTMNNGGSHSNGSEFLVTFGEAQMLNGYHNIVGELVSGDSLLADMESTCDDGKVSAKWSVSAVGHQH